MALIDKDTIRKEIERRIKIYGNPHAGEATQYDVRKKHALVGLLDYLDSLPEQPVEGIKEELKRYLNSDEYINTRENGTLLIARHFAEWGAEQKAIEPFRKQNCKNCGSQRCAGEGEWLEGCEKFREWKDKTYKN